MGIQPAFGDIPIGPAQRHVEGLSDRQGHVVKHHRKAAARQAGLGRQHPGGGHISVVVVQAGERDGVAVAHRAHKTVGFSVDLRHQSVKHHIQRVARRSLVLVLEAVAGIGEVHPVAAAGLNSGTKFNAAELRLALSGLPGVGADRLRGRGVDPVVGVHRIAVHRAVGVGQHQGEALAGGHGVGGVDGHFGALRHTGRRQDGGVATQTNDAVGGIHAHRVHGEGEGVVGGGQGQRACGRIDRDADGLALCNLAPQFTQHRRPVLADGDAAHAGAVAVG